MGWETIAIAGFNALSAANTMNQGNAAARAAVQQGEQEAKASADKTVQGVGKLQTSFLQSGLTLEGGPMDVLTKAFAAGQTDISRITANANANAKNAVNAARTKALTSLASSAGSLGSTFDNFLSGFSSGFDNSVGGLPGWNPGAQPSLTPGGVTTPGILPWKSA